jgi:hypothetical protein
VVLPQPDGPISATISRHDREADPVKRLHMVHLAIHAQRKAFGDVEETHLTHSELRIYFSDR